MRLPTYLNEVAGLDLAESDIAALEGRTEGWIAALQLAALSIRGREDIAGFIAGFAGDDRFIVDFLVEEVLQRQPDDVQAFLLQTSILDRLTGGLCDAVTGQSRGWATLEALDRGNLFVVPLDARRRWYRYHHLFADMLRARLLDEQPDAVTELHRRAGEWFERHGERDEAIRHALLGENWERAAHLIEPAIPEVRQARQVTTMRRWFGALPEGIFWNRPVLSVGYVGALMANGEFQEVEARLADAERWLDPTDTARRSEMVVADEAEFAPLPDGGRHVPCRPGAAPRRHGGDPSTCAGERSPSPVKTTHSAVAVPPAFSPWRTGATGELEVAHGYWTDAMAQPGSCGPHRRRDRIVRALAEIRIAQGRLREAWRTYERAWSSHPARAVPRRCAEPATCTWAWPSWPGVQRARCGRRSPAGEHRAR